VSVRTYGRTDVRSFVRWRHNQIFSAWWVTNFSYPWCFAGALRTLKLRYKPLLSSPPLPSRQVNMADSWWINFSFNRKISLQVRDNYKSSLCGGGSVIIVSAWSHLKGVGWGSLWQEERGLDNKRAKATLLIKTFCGPLQLQLLPAFKLS